LPWDSATSKVTVLRPLPPSAEALLKEFDAKLRSQIRRALKDGATLHHGPSELDAFYAVFREHMRDLGTPVMPKQFFDEVIASFPDEARITTVRHEGVPIAGGFGFRWRDEFEITWASSLLAYKRMSPNMLLYWGVMSQCVAEGVRVFDFGRCNPGSSTHRFKRQWGGEDVPLHWYWPGGGADSIPRKEQGRFALAARIWKHLPLGLASRLGPYIVRGIP
jgi:FemAB-related protein (PEP-CTERM system-associated)